MAIVSGSSIPAVLRLLASRSFSTSKVLSRDSTGALVVLGLESSADDTCAAVVTSARRILSNVVLKQGHIHEKFGGIHPYEAALAHQRSMPIAIRRALDESKMALSDLDGIAFTRGPGMLSCLNVCGTAAKALAAATGHPLLGVSHMQAHAVTPLLTEDDPPRFPFLVLLVSGAHTLLALVRSASNIQLLATAGIDKSIGACIDRAVKDLEIPWSLGDGAPGLAMEQFADFPNTEIVDVLKRNNFEPFQIPLRGKPLFSYSGLGAALHTFLVRQPVATMSHEQKRDVTRRFMTAAFAQLEEKAQVVLKSVALNSPDNCEGIAVDSLVISGGVASNTHLRKRMRVLLDQLGLTSTRLICPPPQYCTDNAAMIAWVGLSRLQRGRLDSLSVESCAKWNLTECEQDFEESNLS